MQYQIVTKWSNKVVFSAPNKFIALQWLEDNNDPDVFKMIRSK
jgi:hypothetical protein